MFVIPMVGRSSRFFSAGYSIPKYQLELNGESVFSHAVRSFQHYFDEDQFRFLVRRDFGTPEFVDGELKRLGVKNYEVVVFGSETNGQAETVQIGLEGVDDDTPVFIFNIDTFRPGFRKAPFAEQCDGYLEVFRGEGEHWSFVEPGPNQLVMRTTEKQRISNLCSDGLYYFRRKSDFSRSFLNARSHGDLVNNEYYVAPLYNSLISERRDIRFQLIDADDVMFCGTPEEYEALR